MNWAGTLEKYGWRAEEVGNEPFHPLAMQAQQARATGESVARISTTVGTSEDYGNMKVSFTVSIDCLQSEATMNLAGECAFLKGIELVNQAAEFLGMSQLVQKR
jgi:hypothetical protein